MRHAEAMLRRCNACGSFVSSSACEHCGGSDTRATKLGAIAAIAGSGAVAMTLMACYGVAAEPLDNPNASSSSSSASSSSSGGVPNDSGSDGAATDGSTTDGGGSDGAADSSTDGG